jgi:hypothetical protein
MPKQPKTKNREIPPPPGKNASWDEQAAYFEKYDWEDLKKAGYVKPLTDEDKKFVEEVRKAARDNLAAKAARAQLNISFQNEQLTRFLEHAKRKHISPSTLAKSWILERLDKETKAAS